MDGPNYILPTIIMSSFGMVSRNIRHDPKETPTVLTQIPIISKAYLLPVVLCAIASIMRKPFGIRIEVVVKNILGIAFYYLNSYFVNIFLRLPKSDHIWCIMLA